MMQMQAECGMWAAVLLSAELAKIRLFARQQWIGLAKASGPLLPQRSTGSINPSC